MVGARVKLGIDFGTTRIVTAAADRGNFPLAAFESPDGQIREWFPPLVAVRGNERRFGWHAWAVQGDRTWTVLRSLKRLLRDAGPATRLEIGGCDAPAIELATELLSIFRQQLRQASTLAIDRAEPLEAMIGVPANSNSNQRFLTAEAFRAAGFQVLGMLNEPSAASVEYGHRERTKGPGESRRLLVYDLGGGAFDASLVDMADDAHTVMASAGLADLGGDDFDEILAELTLETAGRERESLSGAEFFHLMEECRERKEALNPSTRRIVVDLERVREGWGEVSIGAGPYYERCRPLTERTAEVVREMLAAHPEQSVDTLYVTGGGSELPAVARVLKETFGRAVRRSAYMRSATAIGLAISAGGSPGYMLRDRFARHFGVWREADHGRAATFDVLFPAGLELPRRGAPPLRAARAYRPAHNIGHFRYVEAVPSRRERRAFGRPHDLGRHPLSLRPGSAHRDGSQPDGCEPHGEWNGLRSGGGILVRFGRDREGDDLQSFGGLPLRVHARALVGFSPAGRRDRRGETRVETPAADVAE